MSLRARTSRDKASLLNKIPKLSSLLVRAGMIRYGACDTLHLGGLCRPKLRKRNRPFLWNFPGKRTVTVPVFVWNGYEGRREAAKPGFRAPAPLIGGRLRMEADCCVRRREFSGCARVLRSCGLPTFNQLVRKGRTAPRYKTASPALQASPQRRESARAFTRRPPRSRTRRCVRSLAFASPMGSKSPPTSPALATTCRSTRSCSSAAAV